MTENRLIIIGFIFFNLVTNAQNFREDALDSNTAIIFNPISGSPSENTLSRFSDALIENGFNLVGKYIYTNSEVSRKEIEFDMKNKNVKYIFMLTLKVYKGEDYDFYYYEYNSEINPDIIEPDKEIEHIKPGFVKTSYDFQGIILKKLKKKVDKFKSTNPSADKTLYDSKLINTLILTEENIDFLTKSNNKNTIIDGVTLSIENDFIPSNLSSSKLAVVGSSKEEYRGYKLLNTILRSKIKKYPYDYTYFETYDEYIENGGDEKFTYRLQLSGNSYSFLSLPKKRYSLQQKNEGDYTEGAKGNYRMPVNYQKDLFAIILKDNKSGERYFVSDTDFLGRSIKSFIGKLN